MCRTRPLLWLLAALALISAPLRAAVAGDTAQLAENYAFRRDWTIALFEATSAAIPGDEAQRALSISRHRARREHKSLLDTASFNQDPRRARLALATALRHLMPCHELLTR
ncbi:hypothetical protein HC022_25345 [Salipiger sp. HF18]|uniref:hypothetical protein n=1 Tax=Salipiger sp. HF18 TaxID=2721557 RepID=UPI00142D2861|nr:hypothetical protein [Salipiger sp. HF18]NIY99415.1 hypothetical protein [Salipiger sp. HF18]